MDCLLAACLLLVCVAATRVESATQPEVSIVTYPPGNTYIPSNSDEDVVYNCTVKPLGNATATLTWEVDNTQLSSQELHDSFEKMGIYIYYETDSEASINITQQARTKNRTRKVQCVGTVDRTNSDKSDTVYVIPFGSPSEPRDLRLEPGRNGALLEWNSPQNTLVPVQTTYNVTVASVQDKSVVYVNTTTLLYLPLRLVENHVPLERECELYEISVYAVNDAGRGLMPASVNETIPQSPNVSALSQSLAVEAVTLGPLSVVISFAEAEVCSENFTLTNYSAVIDGRIALLVGANEVSPSRIDGNLRLELNESNVQDEFLPGSTYEVAVHVCTAVTCRTSSTVVLNTTDTQQVEILMFEDRFFVRCTFADQSDALGCNVRFIVGDGNETELFQVSREKGFLCNQTNYRLREYSSVTVNDLGANGTEGNTTFFIVPREIDILDEFLNITQCPPDVDDAPIPSTNIGAIIAGVLCPIAVIITSVAVIVVAYICIKKRKLKGRKEYKLDISECSEDQENTPDIPHIVCTKDTETSIVEETDFGPAIPTGEDKQIMQNESKMPSNQQQAHFDRNQMVLATEIAKFEGNIITIKTSLLAQVLNIEKAQYSKLKVKFE